jgi:virulence-associated protein VapD
MGAATRSYRNGFGERAQTAFESPKAGIGHNRGRRPPVTYAIAFDLDTKTLEQLYNNASWQNAYNDIGRFLREQGFDRQQGSVYFGNDEIDAVRCQNAVMEMTMKFPWFASCVKDIRMLRIEDNNDLMSAIELATRLIQR